MLGIRFCISILLFCCHVSAANHRGNFFEPEGRLAGQQDARNEVFYLGHEKRIRWETTYDHYDLILYQVNTSYTHTLKGKLARCQYILMQMILTTIENMHRVGEYNWNVSTSADLNQGNVFMLKIRNASNYDDAVESRNFNVTKLECDSNNNKSDGGLSDAAKVGIGVGVGLGCAFLIALAAIVWFFRRRLAAVTAAKGLEANSAPTYTPYDTAQVPFKQSVAELHGERGAAELPAVTRQELP